MRRYGRLALIALTVASAGAAQRSSPAPATRLPPLPPARIDETLAIGGEDINGRALGTRMTVAVEVNGRGPYRFLVDSGADSSVIGGGVAHALQLPATTPVTLHASTGTSEVARVKVDTLGLGTITVEDLELPVLNERDLGSAGVIGIDALTEQRLMLDFEARVIKVEDARKRPPRMDGEIVVTARRRRGQLILTQARANGRPVEAVIDTGSELTVGNLALRDQVVKRYGDKFGTVAVTGVTGVTVNLPVARIAELRLGPVILQNVAIAFADVPPFRIFGLADAPALLLGTDLMATFRRVSLDFRARKVRFQLRHCEGRTVVTGTVPNLDSRLSLSNGSETACRR